MSSIANFAQSILDPFDLFTNREGKENAKETLALQREAFQHQLGMDAWSQDLAERQYNLAKTPVSSVVNDARSVGVNPMAALGQSVGSVSVPSSNLQSPNGASTPSSGQLGSLLSTLGATLISSNAQKEIHQNALEEDSAQFYQNLRYKYAELEAMKEIEKERNETSKFSAETERQKLQNYLMGTLSLEKEKFIFDKIDRTRNFVLESQEFSFDKILAKKNYSLDYKRYQLEKSKFDNAKHEFEKEFNLKKSELNNKLAQTRNQKMFQDGYLRMRYITSFVSEISDLAQKFFAPLGVDNAGSIVSDHAWEQFIESGGLSQ